MSAIQLSFKTILTIALAITATGCMNFPGEATTSSERYGYTNYSGATDDDGSGDSGSGTGSGGTGFSCPETSNVNPDSYYNMTEPYTVCTNRASDGKVLIKGGSYNSETVCVLPAQEYNPQQTALKLDSRMYPIMVCKPLKEGRLELNFEGVKYNAIYIVSYESGQTMQNCIDVYGYKHACPPHSYGRVR